MARTTKTLHKPGRSRLVPDCGPLLGAAALALLLAACGGRPAPLAAEDGALQATPDAGLPAGDGAPGTPPTIPPTIPPNNGCVVAIRVDNCCQSAYPAPAPMVAQDPCLVPYPPPYPLPKACKAKWPQMCELVDCAFNPPVSRLARPVPGGTCAWKTECNTAADCRLAINARRCCDCPSSWPWELVKADPCIHDYLLDILPPKHCRPDCAAVKCGSCAGTPKSACVESGTPGIKVCSTAAP